MLLENTYIQTEVCNFLQVWSSTPGIAGTQCLVLTITLSKILKKIGKKQEKNKII